MNILLSHELFYSLKEAGQMHLSAILSLGDKYHIQAPVNITKSYLKPPLTERVALMVLVQGEKENIRMYEILLTHHHFPEDVTKTFKRILSNSKDHLKLLENEWYIHK
ncbi:hypothetical protein SM124_05735 [Bacillus sp. 31A1R]|uniref:Rubrerythrin diiron-binding domain-containing protein n=1 Tax=Robertmurraya mangrovi TaxID=3098077 RepID=A0ABU5IVQ7_9BACI|nr:hypothetical protein [Bacillus sp. 31A1R]MDZ5471242.1 hypothetical protein [Bacillus sp. 31A1R]